MRVSRVLIPALAVIVLLLAACEQTTPAVAPATSASPVATSAATSTPVPLPTPAPVPTNTPTPRPLTPTATPVPATPTPAPTPTSAPAPTPTPAPTATPDPCAGILDPAARAACLRIQGGGASPTPAPRPRNVADAAALLLANVTVPQGSVIYGARDPFPAGSTLTIQPDEGDALSVRVTDIAFFFFIDDAPGMRFAHPVRYVVTDGVSGRVFTNEWLPVVNGIEWELDAPIVVQGVTIRTLRRATSAALITAPVAFSVPGFSPGADGPAQATGTKIAIIIDGNERQRQWYEPAANQFATDADDMASTLGAQGYDVRRFSGYKGNILPSADATSVERQLARLKTEARPGDEVVLFISAHGSPDGFSMYTKEGVKSRLQYSRLGELLNDIDGGVKVRVVIDACKSGGAVPHLEGRANTTVVTAADDKTNTPVGLGAEPSFARRIVLAARDRSADANGDGKVDEDEALALAQKQIAVRTGAKLVVKPPPGLPAPRPVPSVGPAPAPAQRPNLTAAFSSFFTDRADMEAIESTDRPGTFAVFLRCTARNQSAVDAPAASVKFYVDNTLVRTVTTPGMKAGAEDSQTARVEIPAGAHTFRCVVDEENAVQESNEADNAATLTQTLKPRPVDLTVLPVTFSPSSAKPGDNISVRFTVKNQGGSASASFSNRISLATTRYGTEISLGNYSMPSLAAGASQSSTLSVTIPSTTPLGSYFVTVFTDGFQAVAEGDENNNIGSSDPSKITILPGSETYRGSFSGGFGATASLGGCRWDNPFTVDMQFPLTYNADGSATGTGSVTISIPTRVTFTPANRDCLGNTLSRSASGTVTMTRDGAVSVSMSGARSTTFSFTGRKSGDTISGSASVGTTILITDSISGDNTATVSASASSVSLQKR